MTPTLILVTGQHRSGTSATAGCLQELGIYLGSHLMAASYANRKGHFEDTRVVEIHDRLLESLGASWDRPRAIPAAWLEMEETRRAEARLHAIVRGFTVRADTFAIKDPRAVLFIPMWQRVAADAGFRLTILSPQRKEAAVVASLRAREGWLPERCEQVTRAYGNALEKAPTEVPLARIQFPADLVMAEAWERVAGILNVELDLTRIGQVHSFMDEGLVHHG